MVSGCVFEEVEIMSGSNEYDPNGIAIIGMAARFPGAKNVKEFWRNLREGKESITFFSDDELDC